MGDSTAAQDTMAEPFSDERLADRAEVVFDSDAVCQGCGADPRAEGVDAVNDPAWFLDAELIPNAQGRPGDFTRRAVIRCPACW